MEQRHGDCSDSEHGDCSSGTPSETFEISSDCLTPDGRHLGAGMAEIRQAMRQEGLSFDEARLQLVRSRMLQMGVDSSGMPTDPKTFTFDAFPKPCRSNSLSSREAVVREGSVARAIKPVRAWHLNARQKAHSWLGLPSIPLSDPDLDLSGIPDR